MTPISIFAGRMLVVCSIGLVLATPVLAQGGRDAAPSTVSRATVSARSIAAASKSTHASTPAAIQDPNAPHEPTVGAPSGSTKREDPRPFAPFTPSGLELPGEKPSINSRFASELPPDLQSWETWWFYNRDAYLDVKRVVFATPASDSGFGLNLIPADPMGLAPRASVVAEFAAPALFGVLAEETNPDLLSAALIALGRMNGLAPGAGAPKGGVMPWDAELDLKLAVFVAHAQSSVAESAVLAIGLRAEPRSAMNLAALMNDTATGRALCGRDVVPPRMRAFAAFALGIVAERTKSEDLRRYVVHELEVALTNSDPGARELPVACVSALGLARLEVRGISFAEVSTMPTSSSREALCARLVALLVDDTRVSVVRAHVPTALSRLCQGADEDLRAACVRAVLAALARTDEKIEVKQGCVLALALLARPVDMPADRDARAKLATLAKDGERALRGLALIAAGEIGSRARTNEEYASAVELQRVLLAEVGKGRSGAPGWAGIALGVLGHSSALVPAAEGNAVLRSAFEGSGSTADLSAYGLALGMRSDRTAYDDLVERVVKEGDDRARAACALGLGFLGRTEALAPLRSVIEHTVYRPTILRDAVLASAMLGQKSTAIDMWSWFSNSKSLTVQSAIADVVGSIGDARLVQPMAQWVRTKGANPVTKTYVVRALGRVSDLSPLSWNASYLRDVNYFAPTETLTGSLGILELR